MTRRPRSRKFPRIRNRSLRSESLEPREMLSGGGFLPWLRNIYPAAALVGAKAPANTAPTVAQAINVNNNAAIIGKSASLSVLGADNGGESKLVYQWSVTAAPSGGGATFSANNANAAKKTTATFTKAGTYNLTVRIVDAGGLSVSSTAKNVVVTPTLSSLGVATSGGVLVASSSTLSVSGVSQALVARGLDQFGALMSGTLAATWSATSLPTNATAPSFATTSGVTTVTFAMAGSYTLSTRMTSSPGFSCSTKVSVSQTLSRITVSPGTASVVQGSTQQFAAAALDQFGRAIATQPTLAWAAGAGSISTKGLYTASGSAGSCTVSAKSGSVTGTAAVTVTAKPAPATATLTQLIQSLDADGSISRADMIQILRSVGTDGTVDAGELAGLRTMLSQAATLNIPVYVQALANDVVNGNAANAKYQGQALGNLAAGSSSTQLNKLVDKWFMGTDHPTLCNTSLVYTSAAGSLFAHTPSHADEFQGGLGDCYFISAMGTMADSNPAAVQNMFIDNGDGTFTVRFYYGTYGTTGYGSDGGIGAGFKEGVGTADYVTVDRMLVTTSSGVLYYANYGSMASNAGNTLWIALAEKAYAQWDETGKEGRSGVNAFQDIQGGWMATVDAQVLGYNAKDYIMTNTQEQMAINALATHKAVTIGTLNWWATTDSYATYLGLYANHAYAIVGYNASTDKFTLYNPWGSNQPSQVTWSQLQAATSQMCIADTSGTLQIAAVAAKAAHDNLSASLVDAAMASGNLL